MGKYYKPREGVGLSGILCYILYIFAFLVIAAIVGSIFSCDERYSDTEIERIREEAVENYIDEFGNSEDAYDEGYHVGRLDAVRNVLDLLDEYGIDDQSLIDDINILSE